MQNIDVQYMYNNAYTLILYTCTYMYVHENSIVAEKRLEREEKKTP